MSSFDYLRSTITKYRSGSIDDPYVDITESRRIINGQIQLSEIPVVSTKVRVLKYFEVPSTNLEELRSNEYRVDYTEGIVSFSSIEEGKDVTVSYKGRGNHYVSASRVWTKEHDGEVIETLKDVVEKSTSAIEQIDILGGVLDEVKVAIGDTHKATISANDAAVTANTQANYAKQQGDFAKEQGDNAQEKGLLAESQGIYAKEQGDIANEAARNAADAATNANNTTSKANQAAIDANDAKDKANEAASNANDAAINAEVQGDYARQHGDYAKQQGDYAKEQGTVAKDLIPILEEAVDSASSTTSSIRDLLNEAEEIIENTNAQAVYAKEQGDLANKVGMSLVHKGAYSPEIAYENRNIVYFKGSTYMCLSDSFGNDPTNELYWAKITNMLWKGTFTSTEIYQFGDIVTDAKNENIYMCVSDNDGESNPSDSPNWVLLISVAEAISNANIATNQAVTATDNANQAASNASDSAGNASAQAEYAKEQGDYAYKQATQIISLEENIKTATQEAKIATQAATSATQEMNKLIDDAQSAVISAKEAADLADENSVYAKEQGDYAKEQGIEANVQAIFAESHAEYAKAQGDYAKQQGEKTAEVGTSLVNKGTYDESITYKPLNIVVYGNGVYQNKKESIGIQPTDTEYWQLLLETNVSVTWDSISGKPNVDGHLINYNNPHQVTAEQVGSYSKERIDEKLSQKQDKLGFTPEDKSEKGQSNGYAGLDFDGKVPINQLSVATQTEAEEGTTTEKLMTPQRVAQAITKQAIGQRTATIVVAASDSSQKSKDGADYVCTGTDDQTTINAAINALPLTGGKVLLMEGLYIVSESILLSSDVTLDGMGASTIIRLRNGHNARINIISNIDSVNGNANIEICNLTIDGNKANQISGDMYGVYQKVKNSAVKSIRVLNMRTGGIRLYHFSSVNNTITGTICTNSSSGIDVDGSHNTVTGNICSGNSNGIYITGGNNIIEGNTCSGNSYGINISGSNNNVTGNTCNLNNYNNSYGIYVNSESNSVTGNTCNSNNSGIYVGKNFNTITANTCCNNSNSGIYNTYSDNNTVTGNTCRGNTNGIYNASTGSTIAGNTCSWNSNNGIYIISAYNAVTGNTCCGNINNGIFVDDGHSDNTITGNTCTDSMIGIRADSTNSTIIGNTCVSNRNNGIFVGGSQNNIQSNTVRRRDFGDYGIYIGNYATDNIVMNNDLYLSGNISAFSDNGMGTRTYLEMGNRT